MELDRIFETTEEYAEAVKDVAREEEVGVVDAWTLLWEAAGKVEKNLDRYLCDGLHLTRDGYQVCASSTAS